MMDRYTRNGIDRPHGHVVNPLDPNPHLDPDRACQMPLRRRGGTIGLLAIAIVLVVGIFLVIGLMAPRSVDYRSVASNQTGQENLSIRPLE